MQKLAALNVKLTPCVDNIASEILFAISFWFAEAGRLQIIASCLKTVGSLDVV